MAVAGAGGGCHQPISLTPSKVRILSTQEHLMLTLLLGPAPGSKAIQECPNSATILSEALQAPRVKQLLIYGV